MGKALILATLLTLGACAHEPTGGAGGAFCDASKPIRASEKLLAAMSRADKEQVAAHNRRGARECGWKAAS